MIMKINKFLPSLFVIIGIFILVSCTSMAQDESSPGVLQGVYTSAQAERGSTTFTNICRNCHVPRDFRAILQQSENTEALISDYYQLISMTE